MNRKILAGLILAMVLPALDLMALGAAGPEIAGDLGRLDQVAWLFVSYQLALVVSVPLCGKLGDLRGRRVVFLSSVTVFTLASLLAGVAWSFEVLLISRVVQGLGGGGIISQTHAVIADLVSPRERGRYSWVTPSVWTIASFFGPVLGGVLAEHLSWRWIFLINLPFGLLAMWFVRGAFPTRPNSERRTFDLPGAVMLVVSYGALVFAVSVGGDLFEWTHPAVLAAFVGGGVVLVGFVVQELRSSDPVMPLRLLRIAVASTIVGRLVVRTGHYRIWPIIGSAVFASGYFVLASLGAEPNMAVVWTGTALLGLGMGAGSPVFMLAMQNAVPHRDVGVVSAMAMFSRNTGQAFGFAIAGAVFVARLSVIGRQAATERVATRRMSSRASTRSGREANSRSTSGAAQGSPSRLASRPARVHAVAICRMALSTVGSAAVTDWSAICSMSQFRSPTSGPRTSFRR